MTVLHRYLLWVLFPLLLWGAQACAETLDDLLSRADPFSSLPAKELEQLVTSLIPLENQASEEQRRDIDLFKLRHFVITGKYAAAEELIEKLDQPNTPPEYRIRTYTIALALYHVQGKYVRAFNLLSKLQQLLPWTDNTDLQYLAVSTAPDLYIDAGDLDKALDLSRKALRAAERTGKAINLCGAYDALGGTYLQRKELKLAEQNYQTMLAYCNSVPAPLFSGMALGGLGLVLQARNQHEAALEKFEAALELSKHTNYDYGIYFSLINLAKSHLALGHQDLAKHYVDMAIPKLESTSISQDHTNAYALKSELSELEGDYKEALAWFKKKSAVEKRIMNNRKTIRIAQLQVEFEVKNKEQHIEQLIQENRLLALQKKNNSQQSLIIIMGLIITALVVLVLWLKAQRERSHFKHMSQVDPLTGLYNHAYCYSLAEERFHECRQQGKPFTVVVADIDWFKYVNDTYGHAAGDKVLQHIASILKECLGREGIVGRTGGEEFTCFLPGKDLTQAMKLVEDCRRSIRPVVDYGKSIEVTLSYGLAQAHGNYNTLDTLVRDADEALYKAKRNGRNQVLAFSPARKTAGFQQQDVENGITNG